MITNYKQSHWQINCCFTDLQTWKICEEYLCNNCMARWNNPLPYYVSGSWCYKITVNLFSATFEQCDKVLTEFACIGVTNLTAAEVV